MLELLLHLHCFLSGRLTYGLTKVLHK